MFCSAINYRVFSLAQLTGPANDDFALAVPVTTLPFNGSADLTAATVEAGEPTPSCTFSLRNTVWYSFTPATTGSVTLRSDNFDVGAAAYTGTSLADLNEVGCGSPLTFRAQAGTTYRIQIGVTCCAAGPVRFGLAAAVAPVAEFFTGISEPSSFDQVPFFNESSDPAGAGITGAEWRFGDGGTATGCCPSHRFGADGDYTVTLTVTTRDGRTASTSNVVQVRTHDVAVVKLAVPTSARVGKSIRINADVENTRITDEVSVALFKSVPGGWRQVGSLTQTVVARRPGSSPTRFPFANTITQDDANLGKVSFRVVATIVDHHDALPADNELVAPPTRVSQSVQAQL